MRLRFTQNPCFAAFICPWWSFDQFNIHLFMYLNQMYFFYYNLEACKLYSVFPEHKTEEGVLEIEHRF
jgi:hypothetical protein